MNASRDDAIGTYRVQISRIGEREFSHHIAPSAFDCSPDGVVCPQQKQTTNRQKTFVTAPSLRAREANRDNHRQTKLKKL